jgi:hypothetical protein
MKIRYEIAMIWICMIIGAFLYGYMILANATAIENIEEKITPPTYKYLDEDYYHPYEYQKKQNEIRIERDSIVEQQIQKST